MPSKLVFRIGVCADVFLVFAVSITSILMRQFLDPFHQGFFRDDQTLMRPYKDSSITNVMLYTIGFITPTFAIILTEFVIVKLNSKQLQSSRSSGSSELSPQWKLALWKCYGILCAFYFGAAATHMLTNIGKYSIGRLRPHFFDVCKPDWSLLKTNDTSGYIEQDICTQTDEKKMTEARLSFPSGHSSIAMYCAIFFCIYLYKRLQWRRVTLLCPLFQLVVFGTAVYTMMSRIHDFKHHWSDALAGGLLGALIALIVMLKVFDIYEEQREPMCSKKNIAMVDTGSHNHPGPGRGDSGRELNTFM